MPRDWRIKTWFVILITIPFFTNAQSSLLNDSTFFKAQAAQYQIWLQQSGMGQLLRLEDIVITSNAVNIVLVSNLDSPLNFWPYWKKWSADFKRKNQITLEQKLFYKLHHFLEVEQRQVLLNIYDQRPKFCHRIMVAFTDGKVVSRKQSCRVKERDIEVSPSSFYDKNPITYEAIQKKYNKRAVYNTIINYSKKKYEKSKCELRYPKVSILEQEDILRFIITDLCKEVLKDEGDPWICRVLKRFGHQCNWIKREKLEFMITYQTTNDGIKIGVQIDGKYGSGYYEHVKRGGYHLMDNDFDEYLEEYADQMKNEFKKAILGM